ncbi:MAG: glycosyltransferase [Pseudomonadota bacterium]
MKIVGVCRFSYTAIAGWKKTKKGDVKATASLLYDEQRMRERFELFESTCLPSMTSQTDNDFKLLIVASLRMPEPYRNHLDDLVSKHPHIEVHYLRPKPMPAAVTTGLRRVVGSDYTGPVVQFCIDDDDALSVHYIERLRKACSSILASEFAPRLPIAYANPRGITLSKKDGVFSADENFAPFLALGLAIITTGNIPTNVYVVPHFKTPTRLMSFSDPDPITYIRGLHDFHDSAGRSVGRTSGLNIERLQEILKEEFPFLTQEVLEDVYGYSAATNT